MIDDKESKEKFARALKENPHMSPAEVASIVFTHMGTIIKASNEWVHDPFVLEEMARLGDILPDVASKLPTKEEVSHAIWERTKGTETPSGRRVPLTPKEFLDTIRLYAEVNGMIEKPQVTNNTQVNVNIPKVISAPSFNDDLEWEKQVAKQQRELLNESATKH